MIQELSNNEVYSNEYRNIAPKRAIWQLFSKRMEESC